MGFLHEGHLSLIRTAREECDVVIASIFVNPTQFAEDEDLDDYPRDEEGDAEKCRETGVDILWVPHVDEVYEEDHSTEVSVSGLTDGLCGASRPSHFDGVTTIVTKLFNLVQPNRAYFGEKDYQQLAVIRRMVRDLNFPINIVGVPIVRDENGLALSSRNSYLNEEQRQAGLLLNKALERARTEWVRGNRKPSELRREMRELIDASEHTKIDYIEVVDPVTLTDLTAEDSEPDEALAALAVFVGNTRLIDNRRLDRD
jgi:pantoate--beta-alanine ligase